jgi:hypothetical protein
MKNGTNGTHQPEQPDITASKFADMFEGAAAFGQWIILKKQALNSELSAGGIVLPEGRRDRPGWEVISIGEAVKIPVKLGDFVMFDGNRIVVDESTKSAYAIAAETQVMCKLDPELTKERMVSVVPHIGMM